MVALALFSFSSLVVSHSWPTEAVDEALHSRRDKGTIGRLHSTHSKKTPASFSARPQTGKVLQRNSSYVVPILTGRNDWPSDVVNDETPMNFKKEVAELQDALADADFDAAIKRAIEESVKKGIHRLLVKVIDCVYR